MPINPKSTWPFTPFLVANIQAIEVAAKAGIPKEAIIVKTIERFFRAGARVMEHYGVPADVAISIAHAQILREGGQKAKARLEECDQKQKKQFADDLVKALGGVTNWLEDAKKATDEGVEK